MGKVIILQLVVFLLITSHHVSGNILDSVGVEKQGKRRFILHKVDRKETLYSISRKYQVTVNDIQSANPQQGKSLEIGDILKVPYTSKAMDKPATEVQKLKKHKVQPKETFYSISNKYKISVEELKQANKEVAQLKVGSEISIPEKKLTNKQEASPVIEKKVSEETIAKAPAIQEKEAVKEQDNDEVVSKAADRKERGLAINNPPAANTGTFKKTTETGYAELMEDSNDQLKYLALHKTAPVGTIIHVENEENNQKIFVRVSGKLLSSERLVIKLSPKAMERLGGKSTKVPVNLTYIP